jgi:hypothetical protein
METSNDFLLQTVTSLPTRLPRIRNVTDTEHSCRHLLHRATREHCNTADQKATAGGGGQWPAVDQPSTQLQQTLISPSPANCLPATHRVSGTTKFPELAPNVATLPLPPLLVFRNKEKRLICGSELQRTNSCGPPQHINARTHARTHAPMLCLQFLSCRTLRRAAGSTHSSGAGEVAVRRLECKPVVLNVGYTARQGATPSF